VGQADREREIPWDKSTLSSIGSISKQFTAAAILHLVAENKFSLEDPISTWLRDLPAKTAKVTLDHLLTHSAGLPDLEISDNTPLSRAELLSYVSEQNPAFDPGSRYDYSNVGYSLLALIIEKVSGLSYLDYLRKNLFAPAGMSQTGYAEILASKDPLAVGYFDDGTRFGTMRDDMYLPSGPSWVLKGNGGMYASNADLASWTSALAKGRVLPEELVSAMWSQQIDESNGADESFYGFGWVVVDSRRLGKIVLHNGDDGESTFFADLAYLPERDVMVLVRSNSYRSYPGVEDLLPLALRQLATDTN
jgi:CubicO group peptidase (beta-lactamase class C family)